jgi:RNA-splicing ligase RtcB
MCGFVGSGVGRFIVNCCMVNLCTKMKEDTWRLYERELTRTVFAMSLGLFS